MFVSVAAVLGATLGTVSGALTLCGLSVLCRNCQKGKLERGDSDEPDKAKDSILHTITQFSVHKSTEPIQPQTLQKFPIFCDLKSPVTSPEVVNYSKRTTKAEQTPKEVVAFTEQVSDSKADTPCVTSTTQPKLHFSLYLTRESRELHITIIEAEHVSMESGCEGYVSGCVSIPEEQKHTQTTSRKLAPTVQWEEELVFTLPGGSNTENTDNVDGEVALSLHVCDRFSRNVILGTVRFKLADVSMMSDADCWVNLQPPKQVEAASSTGELLLSLSYLPAANRLGVVVMKARGLQSDKLKDTIDLSVKLTLKHQNTKLKKKQTRRVKHKINPVWNEMMMLELPRELLTESGLYLEVLNLTNPGTLHTLGQCQLGLDVSGAGLQHWRQMLDNPRKQIAMWHPLHA